MNYKSQSRRGELAPLLLALLVTTGILGGVVTLGVSWLRQSLEQPDSTQLAQNKVVDTTAGQISIGDRLLIPDEGGDFAPAIFHQLKADGISALRQDNYFEAIANFREAVERYPNAPETRIYLQNARIGPATALDVAVTVPISGSNPNNALEMLRGFAQLQHEFNASGGLNGWRLRLHIADDGDDPEIARRLANQLAKQYIHDDIRAVVGHWTSDVSLAAAEIYNQQKLPFVTPISTTNELSSAGPYSFRTALTNAAGGKALAEFAGEQWQISKVAIFYAKDVTYSEEIRQQFSQTLVQNGGEVVAKFDLTSSTFQARQSVNQAIDAGAEALLIATNNASVDRSLQVIQANQGRLKLLGDLANLYTPKTLDLGSDAEDLVMALSWSIDQPDAAEFVERSRNLWRADVNYATANSYDALKAVVEAIGPSRSRHKGLELSRSRFCSIGAAGPIQFRRSGDRKLIPQLVIVKPATPSRSGTGYDFVSLDASQRKPVEPLKKVPDPLSSEVETTTIMFIGPSSVDLNGVPCR